MPHEPTHRGTSKLEASKDHKTAQTGHTPKRPKPNPIPKGALGSGTAEGAAEAIRKHKKMLEDL